MRALGNRKLTDEGRGIGARGSWRAGVEDEGQGASGGLSQLNV